MNLKRSEWETRYAIQIPLARKGAQTKIRNMLNNHPSAPGVPSKSAVERVIEKFFGPDGYLLVQYRGKEWDAGCAVLDREGGQDGTFESDPLDSPGGSPALPPPLADCDADGWGRRSPDIEGDEPMPALTPKQMRESARWAAANIGLRLTRRDAPNNYCWWLLELAASDQKEFSKHLLRATPTTRAGGGTKDEQSNAHLEDILDTENRLVDVS